MRIETLIISVGLEKISHILEILRCNEGRNEICFEITWIQRVDQKRATVTLLASGFLSLRLLTRVTSSNPSN